MSKVLGIDLSSFNVDLVLLDETSDEAEWTRVSLGTDKDLFFDRLRRVPLEMPHLSFYDEVYLAAIEVPYGTGQAGTQAKLNRIFGAVVACIPPALHIWDVMPGAWRRELGLKGNATKAECAAAVCDIGLEPPPFTEGDEHVSPVPEIMDWPQDALDAFAVAYYARNVNERDALPSTPPIQTAL